LKHELEADLYSEKAALYALGMLSQHEARAFENHLAEGCAWCESELRQFEEASEALAVNSDPVSPSPYVRDLLMARIDREARDAVPGISSTEPKTYNDTLVLQRSAGARPFQIIIPWAIAASIALVAIVSLLTLRNTNQEAEELRNRLAETRKRSEQLQGEAARQLERVQELAQINEVLSNRDHRQINLVGQGPAPNASATVYWDLEKHRWIVTANLPPAPSGKVYQLWFVTPDAKISAGLIKPDDTGHGFLVTDLPRGLTAIAAAAITQEPEGGSEQPTSPIYAVGTPG
jgi:anti-sigma-K factor RskA